MKFPRKREVTPPLVLYLAANGVPDPWGPHTVWLARLQNAVPYRTVKLPSMSVATTIVPLSLTATC